MAGLVGNSYVSNSQVLVVLTFAGCSRRPVSTAAVPQGIGERGQGAVKSPG